MFKIKLYFFYYSYSVYICKIIKKYIIMEIYKTTNKLTGEFYIGLNSTCNPNYLGSGVEIKKQIKKYGKENFIKEILCLITSSSTDENTLREIEHIYIRKNINNSKCINKCLGYHKGKEKIIIQKVEVEKIVNKEVEVEKIVNRNVYHNLQPKRFGRSLSFLLDNLIEQEKLIKQI